MCIYEFLVNLMSERTSVDQQCVLEAFVGVSEEKEAYDLYVC